jgi:hypothetical protein
VKRRAYILGTLAAVLTLHVAQNSQAVSRIVHSAHSFQHYYRDLQDGNSLNPVARVLFSLMLANSKSPEQTP